MKETVNNKQKRLPIKKYFRQPTRTTSKMFCMTINRKDISQEITNKKNTINRLLIFIFSENYNSFLCN